MTAHRRPIGPLLVALLLVGIVACSPTPEIVWIGGEDGGAKLTPCPVADCEPITALARVGLERAHPGLAPIARARLGEPACGPTVNALCSYGGPLGIASRWAVVFDLADGTTRIGTVLCFVPTNDNGASLAWNGQRCLAP
ncbi:MAG TPA: hypothetical protein VGK16_14130 [Candidatus Limnocylindrales bacterium]